jgi:hypothetical protein
MNPPDQPTDTDRRARIAHAESLGYVRCEPYSSIGDKTPRWGKDGSYYSFAQLPTPALAPTPRTDATASESDCGIDSFGKAVPSNFARTLERELSAAHQEAAHYMSIAQKATDDLIFFRADNIKAHQMTCAAGLERDSLRAEVERLKAPRSLFVSAGMYEDALARAEKAEAECLEQARLLGMSGEREADLLGKLGRLESELAAIKGTP